MKGLPIQREKHRIVHLRVIRSTTIDLMLPDDRELAAVRGVTIVTAEANKTDESDARPHSSQLFERSGQL